MSIPVVTVPGAVGSLAVAIASPRFPQALAGVLWRYTPQQQPEGSAGTFTPQTPSAPIGNPLDNDGKFFMIEGVVLEHGDNPPTPYQVVVSVLHNGAVIHEDVPSDGGTGTVGTTNSRFSYTFQIKVST